MKSIEKKQRIITIVAIAAAAFFVACVVYIICTATWSVKWTSFKKLLNLGEQYLSEMRYEEAMLYFNMAYEVEPQNVDNSAFLGQGLQALGHWAIEEDKSLVASALLLQASESEQMESEADVAYSMLGDRALRQSSYKIAEQLFTVSEQLNPDNEQTRAKRLEALFKNATKMLEKGDISGAWGVYELLLRLAPEYPSLVEILDGINGIYKDRADMLMENDYSEEAVILLEKVIDINEQDIEAYIGLSLAYLGIPEEDGETRQQKIIELLQKGYSVTESQEFLSLIEAWSRVGSESPVYTETSSVSYYSFGKGGVGSTVSTTLHPHCVVIFLYDTEIYLAEGETEAVGTIPRGTAVWIPGESIAGRTWVQLENSDFVGWVQTENLIAY